MSADAIAKVLMDIKAKNVRPIGSSPEDKRLALFAAGLIRDPVVVDSTLIYESLAENEKEVMIYEDHPCITPPWPEIAICYQNEHGNVVVMHVTTETTDNPDPAWPVNKDDIVEWDRVKWITHVFVYVGGTGRSFSTNERSSFPTVGPMHLWQFAIYENGEPGDLHWVQLNPSYPMERWDMAHLVVLGSLQFLNCKNVELVEPQRTRAERRRIERTGVRVQTINVFGIGKRSTADGGKGNGSLTLTSVRGHFASYGEEYGRGLLFGKYSGRFWIPQHARGEKTVGETEQTFRLVPNAREDADSIPVD